MGAKERSESSERSSSTTGRLINKTKGGIRAMRSAVSFAIFDYIPEYTVGLILRTLGQLGFCRYRGVVFRAISLLSLGAFFERKLPKISGI
ncbi:MAG: hypothetical protein ACPG6K_00975 [Pseudohongiellaceae bacterium]